VQTAIASALLRDHDMVFGVAMSSLAPVALVVPLFLRKNNGDIAFGVLMVVASTLLCPLVLLPLLGLMGMTQSYLDARSLMLYLFPFTIAPVVIGLLVSKFLPRAKKLLSPLTPYVSSTLLGLIMFILVGSAFNRAPIRSWLSGNLVVLTLLMVWMDFGVYWLIRWAWNESAAITIACRNFAVPASLLLFFHPKAALPSAVGLVVHAFFFQWLMSKKAAPRSISN
jgi:BASS family bile acid:Na+ symporter